MFCDFNKAFLKLSKYTKRHCRDCKNTQRCVENGVIFLHVDGTYQPLHSYSYFENYRCCIKEID